jgi:hypothetical protein
MIFDDDSFIVQEETQRTTSREERVRASSNARGNGGTQVELKRGKSPSKRGLLKAAGLAGALLVAVGVSSGLGRTVVQGVTASRRGVAYANLSDFLSLVA